MTEQKMDNLFYEKHYWAGGYDTIAGIDEVGRGPLAGPVVSAAVILPRDKALPGITDSKTLSDKKRRIMFNWILDKAEALGIGVVWQKEIDRINILNATMKTMLLAVNDLKINPDFVLVDGNKKPDFDFPGVSIVKGDIKSISIAAASIVAKVTRDDIMIEFDHFYPQYQFKKNKGYPTREHRDAIKRYGPCPLHRHSFRLVID
jgi:ribonuclease HII